MSLFVCAPRSSGAHTPDGATRVILYGQRDDGHEASAGQSVRTIVARRKIKPVQRAWDLLSIALSVVAADFGAQRNASPDGWTRELSLEISVAEPDFWNTQADALARALAFLTTDRWSLRFTDGGDQPPDVQAPRAMSEECVTLLSGGLDSLVGAIDLVSAGRRPVAISHVVRGDAEKQTSFSARLGGISHMQLNHNATVPGDAESSQRARSVIFLAFGVMVATALDAYKDGAAVTLHVCENGYIAINPPLTDMRIGSLSTRTAHPEFLGRFQDILRNAELKVEVVNPYATKTKGEMLKECRSQDLLRTLAATSTSCGRFQRFQYRHCGRCVPCQVRRAAFLAWGERDTTEYVYSKLGKKNDDHAWFDDVRSVAMATSSYLGLGGRTWLARATSSRYIADPAPIAAMLQRGLSELKALHAAYGVK
jgi:7-cyano-7-deazaguanine synthase in queuosine biosynthesis